MICKCRRINGLRVDTVLRRISDPVVGFAFLDNNGDTIEILEIMK